MRKLLCKIGLHKWLILSHIPHYFTDHIGGTVVQRTHRLCRRCFKHEHFMHEKGLFGMRMDTERGTTYTEYI